MPVTDFNDPDLWLSVFCKNVGGYRRAGKDGIHNSVENEMLRSALSLQGGQRVLLIGAAYGWVAEDWQAAGINAVAVDTSTYIQATKAENAVVDVLDFDVMTDAGLQAAKTLGPWDWVITEDLLPCLSDDEVNTLAVNLRQLGRVAHWVAPIVSPPFISRPLETYRDWLAPDVVVHRYTGEVA